MGNGSDEMIYLLTMAYAAEGGSVVCADPPYRIDEIVPAIMGASVTRVPLRDWCHDLEAMAAIDADIAFVCNPHNPSGTAVSAEALRSFLEGAGRDSSWSTRRTSISWTIPRGRLLSRRPPASSWCCAPSPRSMVWPAPASATSWGRRRSSSVLRTVRPPFSVGAMAQAAALAALADKITARWSAARCVVGRERLRDLFTAAGYEVVPSQANFVLVLAPDAAEPGTRLERGGVSVRLGSSLGVPGTIRVSVPAAPGFALLERALGLR